MPADVTEFLKAVETGEATQDHLASFPEVLAAAQEGEGERVAEVQAALPKLFASLSRKAIDDEVAGLKRNRDAIKSELDEERKALKPWKALGMKAEDVARLVGEQRKSTNGGGGGGHDPDEFERILADRTAEIQDELGTTARERDAAFKLVDRVLVRDRLVKALLDAGIDQRHVDVIVDHFTYPGRYKISSGFDPDTFDPSAPDLPKASINSVPLKDFVAAWAKREGSSYRMARQDYGGGGGEGGKSTPDGQLSAAQIESLDQRAFERAWKDGKIPGSKGPE